ncbi:MAG: hypothetical protein WBW53_08165 [Terriglobales bacterium]
MKTVAGAILPFPCASNSVCRSALRKEFLNAVRISGSPAIVDLSGCSGLNHEDIDLLLRCAAQVAGRDTQVLFVAGSRSNRLLLEVTRISSLVPIFNSVKEALAYPQIAAENYAEDQSSGHPQRLWSA